MAEVCVGNLKKECSGDCEDYEECLALTAAIDAKSSLRG